MILSKELIVGTAGHIDHGKTALIEAMTGFNGDESAQERLRGITIDLSFSNMSRNGVNIAFIDVPGHERLVKKMVSGAFGFDATLLVVAADEGIMPQTREHLAALDLLKVRQIVVALSKSDLVDDATLQRREEELRDYLLKRDPSFELIDIIATSIHDGQSIERLKECLFALNPRRREDSPFFRYYIDRIFCPKGVGTVVTGTVLMGSVSVGDKLNVAELNKAVSVRGIQVHNQERQEAHSGQRAALWLDISHKSLRTGYMLVSRGYFRGFDRIDVSVYQVGEEALAHGSEILFISAAKRVSGKILYYNDRRYATLRLNEKVFTRFGDPYLLLVSGRVLAGGEVLIPISEPIRKRHKPPLLEALERRDFLSAFSLLLANHRRGLGFISSQQRFALSHQEALKIASGIKGAFLDEAHLVLYPLKALEDLELIVRQIYENNPRAILSPASLKLRIKWASEALVQELFDRLVDDGTLKRVGSVYISAKTDSTELFDTLPSQIYHIIQEQGVTPEAPNSIFDRLDLDRKHGKKALKVLIKQKKIVRLDRNIYVTSKELYHTLSLMREIIIKRGYIDIRTFKAETGMSRKYCIAYLEYLDKSGDIAREGDRRVLK